MRSRKKEKTLGSLSKRLSWLLRHGANESGLAMDSAGFAAVDDVLRILGIDRAALDAVVEGNDKARFEIAGARVRAVQGHSTAGTPVTVEGLEASWEVVDDDAVLYHGTSIAAARSILGGADAEAGADDGDDDGIHAAARTHVHLAAGPDATVGKRAGVDILLVVDPRRLRALGFVVFRAKNGVLLVRRVPREAIVDVLAGTARGESAVAALRALLVR